MHKPDFDFNSLSDEQFRQRFLDWLEQYYPSQWRRPIILRLRGEQEKKWLSMLYKHGWHLPAWPREFGGMGLSTAKQLIYHTVLEDFGAARYLDSGGVLLGPVLIKYGTPEQQQKYLPEILRGEVIWSQGYSETGAGSDLANIRTTAVLDGDEYVINGSKIWTTMLMESSRMFLLVRTSKEARKQQGISFFLMDMDLPGVTRRPIMNLSGEDEFGEVFFDNVRVPAENLIHQLGAGWTVAKALLGTERIMAGSPSLSQHAFNIFEDQVEQLGLQNDPVVQELHARLYADLNDMIALYEETADAAVREEAEGGELSVLKVMSSSLFQKISDASMQICAEHAGVMGITEIGDKPAELHKIFMTARPASIYGGANDVQRDIIARSIMGKAS